MILRAAVRGVGHYLPEKIVTNADLEKVVETSDEWIQTRSGIKQRHFAAEDETTSHMATRAAQAALAHAGLEADEIDAVIVATSTADFTFPSVATMVQSQLGMTQGFAYDVQAVCAGFVFALSTANAQIVSGQAKRVLVIGAETFSRLLDWSDRTTSVLFGDGAGALILEATSGQGNANDQGILSVDLNSDGRYKDILRWRINGRDRLLAHAGKRSLSTCRRKTCCDRRNGHRTRRPKTRRHRLGGSSSSQYSDYKQHSSQTWCPNGKGDHHSAGSWKHVRGFYSAGSLRCGARGQNQEKRHYCD